MVSERGRAWSDLRPSGKVFVHGELWDAESEVPIVKGEPVEVVAVEGMRLRVRPPSQAGVQSGTAAPTRDPEEGVAPAGGG
jgi:membrane-bound serine protease (ClpP class)